MATAAELSLPELGDSSATSLSPEQERQIGSEVVRRMRQGGYIISDPLITAYIDDLGCTLAVHAQSEHDFTFFVVDAPGINAFALPGGYIGIHTGLILASQSESELASVIAHEIAHVTQHHLARGNNGKFLDSDAVHALTSVRWVFLQLVSSLFDNRE